MKNRRMMFPAAPKNKSRHAQKCGCLLSFYRSKDGSDALAFYMPRAAVTRIPRLSW